MLKTIKNNAGILFCFSVFFISFNFSFSKETAGDTLVVPFEFHGSVGNDTVNSIEKIDIQRINYSSIYDVLNNRIELFGLPLGINGHYNNFLSYGALDNNISYSFNGRLLTNHYNGKYNLENYSTEFFERIEILNGSQAAILSPTPSNLYMNFQEIIYDTKVPFTRLWYAQEGGSFIGADGIFSQNFSDGWNFTFGFKKFDDRLDFQNMSTDYWNVRAIIRYNIDSSSSISISDYFTNSKIATSGGSDPENSENIYSPINSTPYYNRIQIRNYRHDLNLTYTNAIGVFDITNTAFFTSDLNERALPRFNEADTLIGSNNTETQIGNRFDIKMNTQSFQLNSGGNIYSFQSNATNLFKEYSGLYWNLYSKLSYKFADRFVVSGGANFGNDSKSSFLGFGERIEYSNNEYRVYLDHSYIENNGLVYFDELLKEKTNLFIVGFNTNNNIQLEGYYRITNNPIYYELSNNFITNQINIDNYNAVGISFNYNQDVINNLFDESDIVSINIISKVNKILNNKQFDEYYPLFTLEGKLNYRLIVNQSELNLGVRGGLLGSKNAPRFIPISNSYILSENSVGMQTTGLSAYSIMKLGNAFVKLEWENILYANYYYVSFYPERGQIVKLSVAWSFFD